MAVSATLVALVDGVPEGLVVVRGVQILMLGGLGGVGVVHEAQLEAELESTNRRLAEVLGIAELSVAPPIDVVRVGNLRIAYFFI